MKYIPAHEANYGGTRLLSQIKYIAVHYTLNDGDTAENNGKHFQKKLPKPASANYFVDENEVVQSVADNRIAYSVGGGKYANTKGGSFYKICTNTNSISIELCNSKYSVPEKVAENAIKLIRELMKKYDIPLCRVIRHYDVTGKLCPAPLVDEAEWKKFKQRIEGVDMEELNALKKRVEELEKEHTVYNYIDENMPGWIKNITEWALGKGIISGTGEGLGMTKTKAENLVIIKKVLGE